MPVDDNVVTDKWRHLKLRFTNLLLHPLSLEAVHI